MVMPLIHTTEVAQKVELTVDACFLHMSDCSLAHRRIVAHDVGVELLARPEVLPIMIGVARLDRVGSHIG